MVENVPGVNQRHNRSFRYLHFYEVIEAHDEAYARMLTIEDYGDYNTIEVVGVVKDSKQEKAWLAKNPD